MKLLYTLLKTSLIRKTILLIALFWACVFLYQTTSEQGLNWYYKANPASLMKDIPFYTVIKEHDPQLYQRIEADISNALDNNHSAQQLKDKVRSYLDEIIAYRVPRASNDAVVAYMKITLKEMQSLQSQGYDLCYQFLYPVNGQVIDISKYVQKGLLEEDMAALTNVVKSSYETPFPAPRKRDVENYLTHVYTILEQMHGDEFQILYNPMGQNVNKAKVCNMTIALFEEILRLPPHESGATLRFMVHQNSGL